MSSNASKPGAAPSTINLASLYECPVCFDYISPPIFQCSNGHSVCSSCSPKLKSCPSCQGPLGTCRNLFMEKALSDVHFPCKFSGDGCEDTMLLTEKRAHEENCVLRPCCSCPRQDCKWQGAMDQIVPHFLSKHPKKKIIQGDSFVTRLNTSDLHYAGNGQWTRLLNCHGHHFYWSLGKQKIESSGVGHHDRFLAAVQIFGTQDQANKFCYKVKIEGHRRQLMWEAAPLSIHDNLNSAAENHECFIVEVTDSGLPFSQNGVLVIDVKIERKSNDNSE